MRLSVLLIALCANVLLTGCSKPSFDNYTGQTWQAVVKAEGQPQEVWNGHYGNPPVSWTQQYGQCKSAIWEIGTHTIYCTFELRGTDWVLIDTSSLPEGAEF